MPSPPLTHHEIMTLIGPFTRQGRQADLAATNWLERKLVFKPIERPAAAAGSPAFCETLELENPHAGSYRLIRRIRWAMEPGERVEARLEAEGKDPGELLARVDAVAPESQFRLGPGFSIARSYRLLRGGAQGGGAQLALTEATAAVAGLSVTFTAPIVKGYDTGEIALASPAGDALKMPDDLLAVLGRDWGLLQHGRTGWKSTLRLRGGEPGRSSGAARQLDRMAVHLAETLADAPARFHERLAAARWRVALHRATPLLLYICLICAAFSATGLHMLADSPARMLIFNSAPILVLLIFATGKQPRIEFPPLPRRSKAADWREPMAPAPGSPQAPQPLRRG